MAADGMRELFVVVVISALIPISFFAGCSRDSKDSVPLLDYPALREEVIQRVRHNTIKEDSSGVAMLPQDLKEASSDGRVYVSHDSTAGLLIIFNIGFGKGLLFKETKFAGGPNKIRVGAVELTLQNQIDQHWYQVGY
jgi:hypothetical protein